MNRILNILKILVFIFFLNGYAFAEELILSEKIDLGEQIYKRSFGRGCGSCHDIASNPQLDTLIQSGELDIERFADLTINGIGGMPAAISAIMAVAPVRDAGLTEDQIIDALYTYLKFLNVEEIPDDTTITPSEMAEEDDNKDTVENAITLNKDFSFSIPVMEYVNINNIKQFYNVDFAFTPNDTETLFQVVNVGRTETIECAAIICSIIKNTIDAIDNDESQEVISGYIEEAKNILKGISSLFSGQIEFVRISSDLKRARRNVRLGDFFQTKNNLIDTLIGLNALCKDSAC